MAEKGQDQVEEKAGRLEELSVEYVPVTSISPNDYNPNRESEHDFELLMRSMREDGFTQPIIAQRDTNQIVDGEHRWRAAQALGYSRIPVVFVDMSPEQMRVATLRHNRARGSEDVELAASVLRDLQQLGALDWAQDELMMDDTELQRLIEDIPAPEELAGEEFSPSWEPTTPDQDERDPESVESRVTHSPGGGEQMSAASEQAMEAARERERKMAAAKTQEERDQAQREAASIFRLMLMFQGDEAELVKRVLGQKGAEKLVAILRDWEARHQDAEQAAAEAAGVESEADEAVATEEATT